MNRKRIGNQNVLQFLLGNQNFFDQSNDEPVLYLTFFFFFFYFNTDISKIIGSVWTNLGLDIQRPHRINLTAAILLVR